MSCRWGRQHHPLEKIAIIRKVSGNRSSILCRYCEGICEKTQRVQRGYFQQQSREDGSSHRTVKGPQWHQALMKFVLLTVIQSHLWAVKFWKVGGCCNLEDYALKNCIDEFSLLSCMLFMILQTAQDTVTVWPLGSIEQQQVKVEAIWNYLVKKTKKSL